MIFEIIAVPGQHVDSCFWFTHFMGDNDFSETEIREVNVVAIESSEVNAFLPVVKSVIVRQQVRALKAQ